MCAYNRTVQKVDEFLANEAKGTRIIGAKSLEDMIAKLKKPRRVMMLVKAGEAVDEFINKLVSHQFFSVQHFVHAFIRVYLLFAHHINCFIRMYYGYAVDRAVSSSYDWNRKTVHHGHK